MNESPLALLESLQKSFADYQTKARIPMIINNSPIINPGPTTPAKPKKKPGKKPITKKRKPVRRTPIIQRGKINRVNQAAVTRKPNSRINPKSTITPKQWLDANVWVGVISSNVKAIRYNKNRYELYVRFKNGSEYKYPGVDKLMARQMFDSSSKGKFIWRRFRRPNRPYQRIK